ncbi:MAG: hypothetical protein IJK65_02165 [Clostridiales bacterium]|nr:hypothetical protein [Clostridiales bacterium]
MTKAKTNKRWLSLLVAMMVILSFSLSSVSAAGTAKTFKVRRSGTYAAIGSVTISTYPGTKLLGTIRFNADVEWGITGIDAGTTYVYSISSMKEGAKITLMYVDGSEYSEFLNIQSMSNTAGGANLRTLTGKIHVDSSGLWKIDTLKTSRGASVGIYFRNT